MIVFVNRVLPRREVSMPYVTWNALLNTTEVSKSVLNRPLEWPCRVSWFSPLTQWLCQIKKSSHRSFHIRLRSESERRSRQSKKRMHYFVNLFTHSIAPLSHPPYILYNIVATIPLFLFTNLVAVAPHTNVQILIPSKLSFPMPNTYLTLTLLIYTTECLGGLWFFFIYIKKYYRVCTFPSNLV